MARERVCQYGNCEETETPIGVSGLAGERPRFCCAGHAGLWLLQRHAQTEHDTWDIICGNLDDLLERYR